MEPDEESSVPGTPVRGLGDCSQRSVDLEKALLQHLLNI